MDIDMDMSDAFEGLTSLQTVRRPGASSYVDGYGQRAADETRSVQMVIRGAKAEEVMQLEQGVATEGAIRFWAQGQIFAASATRQADLIEYDSADWEVVLVDPSPMGGFWTGLAARRGQHGS